MSICDCGPSPRGCADGPLVSGSGFSLAMATVPMQEWGELYDPAKGLKQGTIFPCLDLPFYLTGGGAGG